MAVLIDTSPLIALERSDALDTLEAIAPDDDRVISVITVSELVHGVFRATGDRALRRRAFVEHILAAIDPIPITPAVARVHAEIWAALVEAGTPIGAHDLWIGATAIAHGYGVVTSNKRDFQRVPGLRVIAFP